MAQVIDNTKGFKVIEMSLPESVKAFGGVGSVIRAVAQPTQHTISQYSTRRFAPTATRSGKSWQSATKRTPRLSNTTLTSLKICFA